MVPAENIEYRQDGNCLKTEPMTKEIMRKAKRMALPMWLLANISVNR